MVRPMRLKLTETIGQEVYRRLVQARPPAFSPLHLHLLMPHKLCLVIHCIAPLFQKTPAFCHCRQRYV